MYMYVATGRGDRAHRAKRTDGAEKRVRGSSPMIPKKPVRELGGDPRAHRAKQTDGADKRVRGTRPMIPNEPVGELGEDPNGAEHNDSKWAGGPGSKHSNGSWENSGGSTNLNATALGNMVILCRCM